ncbi:MAG: beta-lactamase family protein [Firmicutes bacterium]|nr:beta-lactamase family protein [Bacillota bacterium]
MIGQMSLDSLIQGYVDRGYFPSCVVSVFDREGTLYRKAFGTNDFPGGKRLAADTDTAYDMASCTKIATATGILMLVSEGKLSLDDRLPDILSEIRNYPDLFSRTEHVTLRQLLTHTSGILDWYPFYVQKGRDFFEVFESFIGKTEVMKGMVYSDMNFMLLGKVLERIKEKDLRSCQRDLKAALGARRMDYPEIGQVFSAADHIAPSCFGNAIEEHMVAERGLVFRDWRSKDRPTIGVNDGNAHYFFDDAAGHAGIIADADAYERLGRLYLTSEDPVLKGSMEDVGCGRGLGWQIDPLMYPDGCGHTGFSGTYIYVCRSKGIGAVALANRLAFRLAHGTNTNEFRRALAAAVYQQF